MIDANPIQIETTRGTSVENVHRGAFVVCDADGTVIASAGDILRPVFPRSAVKSMQALAMLSSGSMGKFHLSDRELALACASHQGEPAHVEGVESFLAHIGLSVDNLECGAHAPTSPLAREALRASGQRPSPLHNNCSGKHSGMLSVAQALGIDPKGYVEPNHPVQRLVREAIEEVIGDRLSEHQCGTDGCSIPTWAAPLQSFARGFARMASGKLAEKFAQFPERLFDAATGNPHLVAGTGHLDTLVMEAFRGRVMQKGGAEGVQCGAIRDRGWGYALKIDDGNMSASQALVANVLLRFAEPDEEQKNVLERFATLTLKNVRGLTVGEMRLAAGAFA